MKLKMNLSFTATQRSSRGKSSANNSGGHTGANNNLKKVKVNVVANWGKKDTGKRSFSNKEPSRPPPPAPPILGDFIDTLGKLTSFNIYLTNEDNVSSVNEYRDSDDDRVEGTYKYDFNILSIHDMIMKRFQREKEYEIKELEKKLEEERSKMTRDQNMVKRKASLRRIDKLKQEIEDIKNGQNIKTYLDKILPLLEEYKLLGVISDIISFTKNTEANKDKDTELPEDPEKQKKRHGIIFDFLQIASKYIKIDLIRDFQTQNNRCMGCGVSFDTNPCIVDENGTSFCSCGMEKISISQSPYYQSSSRVNNSRSNYEDRKNFKKVIMRYQGKQPDKPTSDLYDKLDKYFISRQLPKVNGKYYTSEQIRAMDRNKDGEKDGTNRPLMLKALKDIGKSNYYDHINLILNVYWGWALDDISHLEEILMEDYDTFKGAYDPLPKDRKSSLNSQFMLYNLLKRRGHPCKAKNFKMPTTPDIVEFHETYKKKTYDILGWK
jgi:hypothetical protein